MGQTEFFVPSAPLGAVSEITFAVRSSIAEDQFELGWDLMLKRATRGGYRGYARSPKTFYAHS